MPLPPEARAMISDIGSQAIKGFVAQMLGPKPPAPPEPEPVTAHPGTTHGGCPYCAANDYVAAALSHLVRAHEVTDDETRQVHERLAHMKLQRALAAAATTEVVMSDEGAAVLDQLSACAADTDPDPMARARRVGNASRALHAAAERRNLPGEHAGGDDDGR